MAADSDINDSGTTPVSNDGFSAAQPIPNPVTLGGYVNEAGTGPVGNSQISGDTLDCFRVTLAANQTVELYLDSAQSALALDLNLALYNSGGGPEALSLNTTGSTESLSAPQTGEFVVCVEALKGASKYLLLIRQGSLAAPGDRLYVSSDFVPGEVIVRFNDTLVNAAATDPAASLGLSQLAGGPGRARLVDLGLGKTGALTALGLSVHTGTMRGRDTLEQQKIDTIEAVKALRNRADITSADLNYIRSASLAPNDKYYSKQWHYRIINLPQAWDITTVLPDPVPAVTVAVVDTGIFSAHADMAGQLVAGYDFIKDPLLALDGDGIDPDPEDDDGTSFHGTHVAGTVAALTNNGAGVAGVSWRTKVMPVRVLGANGLGTVYDVLQGVRYAAGLATDATLEIPDPRVDIINLSLGGGEFVLEEQLLFDEVWNRGVIVVAASGNENTNIPGYPASYNNVISVSAVDLQKNKAPYSNSGVSVDIAAPGGDMAADLDGDGLFDGVLSTVGEIVGATTQTAYTFLQGTSMAAPHVSGVVALMKTVMPAMTPAQFETFLATGMITEDLGAPSRDDIFGYGLIDAFSAVVAASGTPPPPLPPTPLLTPSAVNMGTTQTIATVTVSNAGDGTLTVNAPTVNPAATWLTVTPASVDADGLGRYTITIDRATLAEAVYTGTITFTTTIPSTIELPVLMQVSGTALTGDAAFQNIALIDALTLSTVGGTTAVLQNGNYDYTITGVAEGIYFIFAGSDLDNDGNICTNGESCGGYPVSVNVTSDMPGLNFNTFFQLSPVIQSQSIPEIPSGGIEIAPQIK